MRCQSNQNIEASPTKKRDLQCWCYVHDVSAHPYSLSHSALCHRCQSFLTPVCPLFLSSCPNSLSVGWNRLLLEVCLWGDGICRCSRPHLVFQPITRNMTALPALWWWDALFLLSPWGVRIFALLSPSWTSFQDSRSILWERANTTCSGPSFHKCVILHWCGLRLYTQTVQKQCMFQWAQIFVHTNWVLEMWI